MTGTDIIQHDGFTARAYDGYELAHGDTVYVTFPGLGDDARGVPVGDWAEVDEDGDVSERPAIRFWGTDAVIVIDRDRILYEKLHSCECGATAGDSWSICHPDA